MARDAQPRRYVLLPIRGEDSPALELQRIEEDDFLRRVGSRLKAAGSPAARAAKPVKRGEAPFSVLHSLDAQAPKLIAATDEVVKAMQAENAALRVVPEVRYQLARTPVLRATKKAASAPRASPVEVSITLVDGVTGAPVRGATVVAFTDFRNQAGDDGRSNAQGLVRLRLGARKPKVELLLVYPRDSHWGLSQRNIVLAPTNVLKLKPIDFAQRDFLGTMYPSPSPAAGSGVTVGVVDSGVATDHPHLVVAGGAAFTVDEDDAGGWGPARKDGEHGSHVAGIIAARGKAPTGRSGVAPGVKLYSYRVFPGDGGLASNYDILRALRRAVRDRCDLVNLSLGDDAPDEAVRIGIKQAFDAGTVCIAAAGNDYRGPISYPAAWPEAIAVAAAGRKGTFPADSSERIDIAAPYAAGDRNLFIAAFCNVGPQMDLIGPGVGIVSTMPGPGAVYGVMSGTSMACPAVTGAAAALLAKRPEILAMPRTAERAVAIAGLIRQSARRWGFPVQFEGAGHL